MAPKRGGGGAESEGATASTHVQAKSYPRQARKASRTIHRADKKPDALLGETRQSPNPMSPAKKLAKLVRTHHLTSNTGPPATTNKTKTEKVSVRRPIKVMTSVKSNKGDTMQASESKKRKLSKRDRMSSSNSEQKDDMASKERPKTKRSTKQKPKAECKDAGKQPKKDKPGRRERKRAPESDGKRPLVKQEAGQPEAAAAISGGNIAALLLLGEGPREEEAAKSDDSDWEAVETAAHSSELATNGFVEVTLPSDVAMQKKKKKGFDVAAYLKRQMSRARRELQVLVHKTHVLCLLSRSLQINALLNSETMLACAMSMLPSKYAYPPERVTLTYVEKFLKWFRDKVPLESSSEGQKPSENVFQTLASRLRTKKAYTSLELVCLFVLIMRAIGVDCRLVLSLQPAPLKPSPVDSVPASGAKQKTSASEKKPASTKKPKKAREKPSRSGEKTASSGARNRVPPAAGSRRSERNTKRPPSRPAPSSDSDDDFEPAADRRVLSSPSGSEQSCAGRRARAAVDHWAEVYVEEELRWVSVDVCGGGVHCPARIQKHASSPMMYVLGCDNGGHLKDLTARYDTRWHTSTRKLRAEQPWWDEAISPWRAGPSRRDKEEDEELEKELQQRPMPQSIAEFKNHPLYALERHLLKFEAIYPPSAVPLGYIGKGEKRSPVYARECVHMLHSRETWIKQARVVRPGEQPYKIVKARPKWDRVLQRVITDQPLEIFGRWQTDDYVPPNAEGGIVPRNAYGNVELFKPSMLPGGTVHLAVDGLSRVAKKLGIDCAPAMVGWDYHCGGSHPVFEGYVVCEEFRDTLMDAWEQEQREARRRQKERREKRVLDNWRRLVRGLRIRQALADKYSFQSVAAAKKRPGSTDRAAGASKKARPGAGRQRAAQEQKPLAGAEPKPEPGLAGVKTEPGLGLVGVKPKPEPGLTRVKSEPEPEPAAVDKAEEARRVEASIAGMSLGRLALSSDSEADSDAEDAGRRPAGPPPAAACPSRPSAVPGPSRARADAEPKRTPAGAGSKRGRGGAGSKRGRGGAGSRRGRGGARPKRGRTGGRESDGDVTPTARDSGESDSDVTEPVRGGRRSARRSARTAVSYSELAGQDGQAPDEAAAASDSGDDFEPVGGSSDDDFVPV